MDAIPLIVTTMQEHKFDAGVQSEGMRALLNLTTTIPENAVKAASVGAIDATVRICMNASICCFGSKQEWTRVLMLFLRAQVEAMRTHYDNATVQGHACRTLAALTLQRKVRTALLLKLRRHIDPLHWRVFCTPSSVVTFSSSSPRDDSVCA